MSHSLSGCDRCVAAALFLYDVVNVFVGGVAGSALMLVRRRGRRNVGLGGVMCT